MATISITIPDLQLPRVIAALCVPAGVPETPADAKAQVIEYVKERVKSYEAVLSKIANDIDVS